MNKNYFIMKLRIKQTTDGNGDKEFMVQKKHWLFGWLRADMADYSTGDAKHNTLQEAKHYMNSLGKTTGIVFVADVEKIKSSCGE